MTDRWSVCVCVVRVYNANVENHLADSHIFFRTARIWGITNNVAPYKQYVYHTGSGKKPICCFIKVAKTQLPVLLDSNENCR